MPQFCFLHVQRSKFFLFVAKNQIISESNNKPNAGGLIIKSSFAVTSIFELLPKIDPVSFSETSEKGNSMFGHGCD